MSTRCLLDVYIFPPSLPFRFPAIFPSNLPINTSRSPDSPLPRPPPRPRIFLTPSLKRKLATPCQLPRSAPQPGNYPCTSFLSLLPPMLSFYLKPVLAVISRPIRTPDLGSRARRHSVSPECPVTSLGKAKHLARRLPHDSTSSHLQPSFIFIAHHANQAGNSGEQEMNESSFPRQRLFPTSKLLLGGNILRAHVCRVVLASTVYRSAFANAHTFRRKSPKFLGIGGFPNTDRCAYDTRFSPYPCNASPRSRSFAYCGYASKRISDRSWSTAGPISDGVAERPFRIAVHTAVSFPQQNVRSVLVSDG